MTPWYVAYNAGIFASAASVLAYTLLFRRLHSTPRRLSFLLGVLPVSIAAFLVETYLFAIFNAFLALVVIAPCIEEALKFLAVRKGKDFRAALGVGFGFAFAENALYFGSFLNASTVSPLFVALYFLMRGMSDPLLHSYTASVSVRSWQTGKLRWLGAAIAIHAGYNVLAIAVGSNANILMPVFFTAAVILLVLLVHRSRRTEVHAFGTMHQAQPAAAVKPLPETASKQQERPNADLLLANLRDTSRLTQDQFLNSIQVAQGRAGFAPVADTLGLGLGYERTKWLRHATYGSPKTVSHYWEVGAYGLLAISVTIVVTVLILVEVVI